MLNPCVRRLLGSSLQHPINESKVFRFTPADYQFSLVPRGDCTPGKGSERWRRAWMPGRAPGARDGEVGGAGLGGASGTREFGPAWLRDGEAEQFFASGGDTISVCLFLGHSALKRGGEPGRGDRGSAASRVLLPKAPDLGWGLRGLDRSHPLEDDDSDESLRGDSEGTEEAPLPSSPRRSPTPGLHPSILATVQKLQGTELVQLVKWVWTLWGRPEGTIRTA